MLTVGHGTHTYTHTDWAPEWAGGETSFTRASGSNALTVCPSAPIMRRR